MDHYLILLIFLQANFYLSVLVQDVGQLEGPAVLMFLQVKVDVSI